MPIRLRRKANWQRKLLIENVYSVIEKANKN